MSYCVLMLLLAVDYGQTKTILNSNGQFNETNFIIRRTGPELYFGAIAGAATYAHFRFPKESKIIFWGMSLQQSAVVFSNDQIGIKVRF